MWGNAKGKLRTDWIEPDRVHPEGSEAWNPIVPWLQASWRANQCISGCKKHWSSNSFVVIKTCDHFMSIIMSFCGTKGGPNSQKVVWRRFFLQKCQKRRMRNWRRSLKYKSDHVPRTPLQCHMFSSCSWLLSVDSLTYSFVICLCQLSYVTILCHRHSAQDIPVTTLAGDSVLWPSDPIVIVGYGVGPNRTPFSEAGRVLYCLLGRLGNVYCQVTWHCVDLALCSPNRIFFRWRWTPSGWNPCKISRSSQASHSLRDGSIGSWPWCRCLDEWLVSLMSCDCHWHTHWCHVLMIKQIRNGHIM